MNALNPKTALFFLAFLPQFVDPDRGHVGLQAAMLGLVWVAIATVCDAVWALGSGSLVGLLRSSARARRVERVASGGILIGLGVLATLAHPAHGAELERARRGASRATAGPWKRKRRQHDQAGEREQPIRAGSCACRGNAASRIGTAPLSPPTVANTASPCVRRSARSTG